jgi:hypothetical protein
LKKVLDRAIIWKLYNGTIVSLYGTKPGGMFRIAHCPYIKRRSLEQGIKDHAEKLEDAV